MKAMIWNPDNLVEYAKDHSIKECANNGLMVEGAGTYNNVIRFLTPLVITDEQLKCGLDIFENAIAKCCLK